MSSSDLILSAISYSAYFVYVIGSVENTKALVCAIGELKA
jgi:hypothetical protein